MITIRKIFRFRRESRIARYRRLYRWCASSSAIDYGDSISRVQQVDRIMDKLHARLQVC